MGAAAGIATPLFRSEESKANAAGKRVWRDSERFTAREAMAWERQALALLTKEGKAVTAGWNERGEAGAIRAVDDAAWEDYVSRLWLSVVPPAGAMAADFIAEAKAAAVLSDIMMSAAKEWLRMNGVRESRKISNASRKNIAEQIRIGMQKGETDEQIAARLTKRYKSLSPARAQTIAWTETHAATNYASFSAAQAFDVPLHKIWVDTPDDRTRDAHVSAGGQKKPLSSPFVVDGEQLMWPGDSSMGASSENVVNCRCYQFFVRARRTTPKPRRIAA